jgi:hypothetical protein
MLVLVLMLVLALALWFEPFHLAVLMEFVVLTVD